MKYLLIVPYFALLWVPLFNQSTPTLWGFPFFYWYQFVWIVLTSCILWLANRQAEKQGIDDDMEPRS